MSEENEGNAYGHDRKHNRGYVCSMDGYVSLTKMLIELALVAVAIVKETYAAILPMELGMSVEYAWDGLMGAGSWPGYAVAAAYYFGKEFGYAKVMCDVSMYGYLVVDYLNSFISFAQTSE
jgi:hypothetical protein